jgi:hypothetical protein
VINVNDADDAMIDDARISPGPAHSIRHQSENTNKPTETDPMGEPDAEFALILDLQIVILSIREFPDPLPIAEPPFALALTCEPETKTSPMDDLVELLEPAAPAPIPEPLREP